MTVTNAKAGNLRLPILQGILPFDRAQVLADVIAGITLAALSIPEVMGYTKIAGMPVVTGLYTMLIPMTAFALFGSSRHLVVGADSATAAIMAAGLAGLATPASPAYVALAGVLALLAALLLIIARLIRLGFLADFLSRTVLIGFLSGVGIQIAIGQIAGMLGIPGNGGGPLEKLVSDVQQLSQTNPVTLAISLMVVGIIAGTRRISKKIPGALIAVLGAMTLGYLVDLPSLGVSMPEAVPNGLPHLTLPAVPITWSLVQRLLPTAFSMFVVIMAQSAATSRAYAARYGERFSENVDLVGLALANASAGLTGAFVVNGSPTKTQMVDSAGGRTQVAQITTAAIVLLVLLFLTAPLSYIPNAALASVVFVIGIELIDAKGMAAIWSQRPAEFWIALTTAVVVVFVGVEQGIILAIILSLLAHTRHGYRPKNLLLVEQSGHLLPVPMTHLAAAMPGLVIYRFNHSMYYANAEQLSQEILRLIKIGPDPVAWLCIDMIAVDDVDFSAAATLLEAFNALKQAGIRLVFADVSEKVRCELERSGITTLVHEGAIYVNLEDVLDAYRCATGTS